MLFFLFLLALIFSLHFSAYLAGMAAHLDQIVISILALALGLETFSFLSLLCGLFGVYWLSEAFLTISLPFRRFLLLIPGKYTAKLYIHEASCLQTVLHKQQKLLEALKLNFESMQVARNRVGARSLEYADHLISRSCMLSLTGQATEAEGFAREAVEISKDEKDGHPKDLTNLCLALNNLGVTLLDQGKNEQAGAALEECFDLQRQYLPADDPSLARSYGNIAQTYLRKKQYEESARYSRLALQAADACPQLQDQTKATFRNDLAEALKGQGQLAEAEANFLQGLSLREQVLADKHPERAQSYHSLAKLRFEQGRLPESEEYFKKAVSIREKFPGLNGSDLQQSIEDYCLLLDKMGRWPEAESLRQARRIKSENSSSTENH